MELTANTNQALGIANYAIDFVAGRLGTIDATVLDRVALFHLDSVACGVAAIATGMNAPTILRQEAARYAQADGAACFGGARCAAEKAVVANCSAVRELDANGTNFGFNPARGDKAGEFGHNDFYPVAVAAGQLSGADGATTLRAMLCLDEIRGRLAEVFSLKTHRIDHVVHGAIAAAAVYGALREATAEQIESAIGLVVAHAIPFRAIRAGHQLSDSKGASAAWSAETAVLAVERALLGFQGPADIFRNPQAIFRLFEPSQNESCPFHLYLSEAGNDFTIMGMHFKLGIYEHQSAGAIQGLIDLLQAAPDVLSHPDQVNRIRITIYEPAFGIIGDPAKRNPQTRQSADHSMVYIIGTLLRKAVERQATDWDALMLQPLDYNEEAIHHPDTRKWMERIEFVHGGPEFDAKYPEGIPTQVQVEHNGHDYDSGLVMFPLGHARSKPAQWQPILEKKIERFARLGVSDVKDLSQRMLRIGSMTVEEIQDLYSFEMNS